MKNKFPKEIEELLLKRQVEQGNPPNIEIFYKNPTATKKSGGMVWSETVEGDEFWFKVLVKNDYSGFFKLYPKSSDFLFEN